MPPRWPLAATTIRSVPEPFHPPPNRRRDDDGQLLGVGAGVACAGAHWGDAGRRQGAGLDPLSEVGPLMAAIAATAMATAVVSAIAHLPLRALSRYRELAADRTAAVHLGQPALLASALVKVDDEQQGFRPLTCVAGVCRPSGSWPGLAAPAGGSRRIQALPAASASSTPAERAALRDRASRWPGQLQIFGALLLTVGLSMLSWLTARIVVPAVGTGWPPRCSVPRAWRSSCRCCWPWWPSAWPRRCRTLRSR
jgi:hypothetical protein